MQLHGACFVVFCVVLAGCTPQPPQYTSAQTAPQPTATTQAAATAQQQQPGAPITAREVAASGVPLLADFLVYVNPDCTSAGLPQVSLASAPSHGSVTITRTEEYPNFAATNQRYECNKKRMPGMVAHYTSTKGYVGTDVFALSIISPAGIPIEHAIFLTVRP